MAFVTPGSASVLSTPAARRASAPAVCPLRTRCPMTMKKVRRGGGDDDDSANAVDVFGGAGLSQEQLLADALGETKPPPMHMPPGSKKRKKGKKAAVVDDEENAVDVFGGAGLSQEELLADALGRDEEVPRPPVTGKKKKKPKKGKKGIVEDDGNAVDVFAGANKTADELLADALGEDSAAQVQASPVSKKKKKSKKNGAVDNKNESVVDVFNENGSPQEESVGDARKEVGNSETNEKVEIKRRGRSGADSTAEEALVSNSVSAGDKDLSYTTGQLNVAESQQEDGSSGIMQRKTLEVKEEEEFEPDLDVVSEFENASKESEQFTTKGRRKEKRDQRGERNEAEGRLADPRFANFGTGGEKYTSVRLEDVTVTFRNTTILDGVTWGVRTGERVGLIGENGCGKTTQLRLIAGLLEPSSGEVIKSSEKTRASFLRQEFVEELDPTRTLREEFSAAFVEEGKLLDEYRQCEKDIENAGSDLEKLEILLDRLEALRGKCDQKDAWNLDSRIDKVMPGLGFTEEDNDKLVASFSGGWKVRIGLGKVLLQDPDLLLLDEPSNHLDNESVEWLEEYLQNCNLPMVVVSHDREFLDRVCTKIVEIEGGEAFEYPGNYTRFVKLRAEQRKAWESAYDRQQKFVKEQMQYIKQNRRSPARVSQVKSREKMLQRMERTGQMIRRPPRRGKPLVFRFPAAPRSGRECVVVDDLTHGYEGRTLFTETSVIIERGDRIALIGPNGCGKSTLLRMITGGEQPQEGKVECEQLTNISLAYYEQNQADALDLNSTVLDTLKKAAPSDMRYEEVRALLGKFLFKGDDVEKKVSSLSGGEKARLALAKIMLEPANVLILDEPGNHLSISAKEMLEEALQHFDGTLLLVSHDRYLISQVATQILAVEDRQLVLYDGDYKSYMEKNAELRDRLQARFIPGVAEIKSAPKIAVEEPTDLVDKKQKRKKNFGGSGVGSGRPKEMNAKRWNR